MNDVRSRHEAPRVWDAFLTSRDKAHLDAGWRKELPFGLGRRPAVMVVDNTVAALDGRSREDRIDVDHPGRFGPEGWAAIGATVPLLDTARAHDVPVVFTVVEAPNRWGLMRFDRVFELTRSPTFTEVVAELCPAPGELVIRKAGASAFHGTALLSHLVSHGIDTLLVCGNSTSGCVRATVVDAACYGFFVGVVEECTFDRTEASHAVNLFDMDQKYGDVLPVDAVIDHIRRCRASTRPHSPGGAG